MNNQKGFVFIIIAIAFVIALGIFVFVIAYEDEHGCGRLAGEHWCEYTRECVPKTNLCQSSVANEEEIDDFESCAAAGNPVMESYPRQCRANGKIFVENIGNELEKIDLIRIDYPRPNQVIKSPLRIEGEARGYWFFEANLPVALVNWDGLVIAEGFAMAKGEWMTEDFVPFRAELQFDTLDNSGKGTLLLKKSNASGLFEQDDTLEVPIKFE